jgi:hypothetical protein
MIGVELPDIPDTHEYNFDLQCSIRITYRMYHVQKQNSEGIYQNSLRANYMTVML